MDLARASYTFSGASVLWLRLIQDILKSSDSLHKHRQIRKCHVMHYLDLEETLLYSKVIITQPPSLIIKSSCNLQVTRLNISDLARIGCDMILLQEEYDTGH